MQETNQTMFTYQLSETEEDLRGIIQLQLENHKDHIDEKTKAEQGFVTVKHSYQDMKSLNDIEKHIIAKKDDKVVAYVLAMTKESRDLIPVLVPFFDTLDNLSFEEKKISEYKYMVVGQVCVGEVARGKGTFSKAYDEYRKTYSPQYEICITEIAVNNARSLRAHEKVGFVPIHQYSDEFGMDWVVVVWKWR